jgi:hypothetical protein
VSDETREPGLRDEEISAAAGSLRKSWDSPRLWPRISAALELESAKHGGQTAPAPERVGFFEDLVGSLAANWRPALAGVVLFGLATAGLFVFRGSGGRDPYTDRWSRKAPLLTEQAASEVELAEAAYVASIDKLSKLAGPQLEGATSPVLVNNREKLALLDSAISDLKANIEQNRFNTHLREELLAVYREKQRTLQDILQEGKS